MDFVNLGFNVVKWTAVNIGAPLLVNKLVGGSKPTAPTTSTANAVRDSAPGTVNTNGNSDANISQNTLIIGAVALVAVIMLVKKK